MLHPSFTIIKTMLGELAKDPIGTATKMLPKCACGAKTVAGCSQCGAPVCYQHGYFCIGEKDAVCIGCVQGED